MRQALVSFSNFLAIERMRRIDLKIPLAHMLVIETAAKIQPCISQADKILQI